MRKKSIARTKYTPPAFLVRGPQNNKAKGDVVELGFAHKAASLGFGVAKPYGDNERYDFILDSGERFWRVQVRSSSGRWGRGQNGFGIPSTSRTKRNAKPYRDTEIDFFVAYLVLADIWYVIPVNQIAPFQCLSFYPYECRIGGFFESYREAWHLMAPGAALIPQPQTLRRVRAVDLHRKFFVEQQNGSAEPPSVSSTPNRTHNKEWPTLTAKGGKKPNARLERELDIILSGRRPRRISRGLAGIRFSDQQGVLCGKQCETRMPDAHPTNLSFRTK